MVGFVRERAPDLAEGAPPAEPAPGAEAGTATRDGAARPSEEARFPRRIPVPVVRPALEHCVPTGVSLEVGRRVVVMPDQAGIGEALVSRLEKLGVEVLRADGGRDDGEFERQIESWTQEGPVHGVYWLAALDAEAPLAELEPDAWREGLRRRVKLLAIAMRCLGEQIGPEGTFLVAGSRLGGRHGYDAAGATSAMGGAVTGFVKALAREREDALVKAVDFPPSRKTAAIAETLIEETLRDPGAVEVGHAEDLRWSVGLERARRPSGDPDRALGPETVFCVTGAAGSIVAAITADLAKASQGTFHLLDLVPEPDPADPDLDRFGSDREGLKRELAERIKAAGRASHAEAGGAGDGADRARQAALDAIEAIREAGGEAHWHQLDLTDADQVSAAIASALEQSGRIDVLIHCAGLEVSHFLPDKPQSEFDLVFDVKADGWFNLLKRPRRLPSPAQPSSSARSPGGSETPARPTTPPPTTCSARASRACAAAACGAWRSTGPPGRRSVWRAAARSRR